MLLIIISTILSCTKLSMSINGAPGVPIPGAAILEDIFAKHLELSVSTSNYFKDFNDTYENNYADDNLDINVMDMNTFRKLLDVAKKKYESPNYRRQYFFKNTSPNRLQTAGYKTHLRENPNIKSQHWYYQVSERQHDKVYLMLKHSIYAARYRIAETKHIRAKFGEDPSYKIALLASACTHYVRRMEGLYSRASTFTWRVSFIWYLIMYERILQSNVDVNYAVERIFVIQQMYLKQKSIQPEELSAMKFDPQLVKNLLSNVDPSISQQMTQGKLDPETIKKLAESKGKEFESLKDHKFFP